MYASVDQLVEQFGALEMARLCDSDTEPFLVTAAMFAAAASNRSFDYANDDERDATSDAVGRAYGALENASQRMDSKLGMAVRLPVAPEIIIANGLTQICLNIARYFLYDDRATDEIKNRYKDDMSWLDSIAAGKSHLVGSDGGAATPATSTIRSGQANSGFDWSRYG